MIVIPAKFSSSRTPHKNFRPFYNGLSLLQIAIIRSTHAKVGPVIVSSENIDIATQQLNRLPEPIRENVLLQRRPEALSRDPATILDVLDDCLSHVTSALPEHILVVLPTSPFNNAKFIEQAHRKFVCSNAEKLISVSPASKPPYNAWVEAPGDDTGALLHAFPDSPYNLTQSTACPTTYFSNGCISIYSIKSLLKDKIFLSTIGYKMPIISGLDIDFEHEFDIARFLFPNWSDDLEIFNV